MSAQARAADLRAELVEAEAEYEAAPTVDKWNELLFLRRSVDMKGNGMYNAPAFGSAEWFAAQPEGEG